MRHLHCVSENVLLIFFCRLTLILLLHYLVKFKSRVMAVYNNKFIPGSTCFGSKMINGIATNTIGDYCLF